MRFRDRVAVVTGGGSGIGRAVAQRLASEGASVAILDASEAGARETVALPKFDRGRSMALALDVRDAAAVARCMAAAATRLGGIDILVNCAGIYPRARVEAMAEETWDDVLDVNLKGTYLCCKAALPYLRARNRAKVVNIASVGALVAAPGQSAYCASKAGVLGFTRAFALEVASDGICVNAVCPGTVRTGMTEAFFSREGVRERLESSIPLGYIASAADIAGPIAFLCSEDANYLTGQSIVIDGGLTLM